MPSPVQPARVHHRSPHYHHRVDRPRCWTVLPENDRYSPRDNFPRTTYYHNSTASRGCNWCRRAMRKPRLAGVSERTGDALRNDADNG